jgi:predicted transposase/invertase (TIGR01784 family)
MPLGIDPKVDYVFKKLFGDPANSDLLIHLLNAVLMLPQPIVEVEILNPFNDQEYPEDKGSILDLKARCGDGRWYNVEMQSALHKALPERLAYYNASLYVDQLESGDHYHKLKAAITICFLSGVLFANVAEPHLKFLLCDAERNQVLTELVQVHTVELPKYNFSEAGLSEADDLSQWAYFLSRAADLEAEDLKRLLPDPEFAKATGVVEMIAKTPEERMRYEARLKAERDHHQQLLDAEERGEARGEARGEQRGVAIGEQRGVAIGEERGRKNTLAEDIRSYQALLKEPLTPSEELATWELAALQALRDELFARIGARF